jgi:hypothetical protein
LQDEAQDAYRNIRMWRHSLTLHPAWTHWANGQAKGEGNQSFEAARQMIKDYLTSTPEITGTIRYLSFEGGFYGIVTDDGQHFDPVNLPDSLKEDGLRIRARVERMRGWVSIHMWGHLVRIITIERL